MLRSQRIIETFDEDGRVKTRQYLGDDKITYFQYDAVGNLIGEETRSQNASSIRYIYDAKAELVRADLSPPKATRISISSNYSTLWTASGPIKVRIEERERSLCIENLRYKNILLHDEEIKDNINHFERPKQ